MSGVTTHHDSEGFEWRVRITHEDARRLDPVDLALVETGLAQVAGALDRLPPPAPIEGTAREHATAAPALPPAGAAA